MGLFWKTRKPDPQVVVEGVAIRFHRDYDDWEVNYRGTRFLSFELALTLPSRAELDSIVETIESLKADMRSRLEKTLSEYNEPGVELKLDDGESYSVNVDEFANQRAFIITWSGGASWGDLAADFTIKDGAIVEEGWGD